MNAWRISIGSMMRSYRWRAGADTSSAAVPGALGSLPSPGRPLDTETRAAMEPRFAHDFGNVRVHTDSEAAASARSIHARAYTVGSNVVFGQGEFRPRTDEGQSLIAHELAHVMQNDTASTIEPRMSQDGEPSEQAAHQVAQFTPSAQRPAGLAAQSSVPALQRQPADTAAPDFRLRPSPWFMRSMGRLSIDGFVTGQSSLSDDQRGQIAAHAATLRNLLEMEPGGRVTITGHGDAVGTETRNQELGVARAEAVRAVLVEAGVPADRIDVDSSGESDPAVASPGAEPRNRRAVIGFSPALRLPGFGGPGLRPPSLTPEPTPDLRLHRDPGRPPPYVPRPPTLDPIPAPPSDRSPRGLRDFFERDPLLRMLPQPFRDWALGGLEKAPEGIAGIIADQIPLEGEQKEAIAATLRALALFMQGRRWSPPPSRDPRFDMPPARPFPSVPGQTIIPGPTFRF